MLDISKIKELVEQKYINVQKHPSLDLYIYNYSQKCQYDKVWNAETLACRGLVMDAIWNIIARPFNKFFNYEEVLDKLPNEPFTALEKMDGSLGIVFKYNGDEVVATRGSFTSEQAIYAEKILNKYPNFISSMNDEFTYLCEIIYPENRICVNYGTDEKLVLLSIIQTKTGIELPYENLKEYAYEMPVVKKYECTTSLQELQSLNFDNQEGFVIRYKNGYRVKVKFEEYVRLHRIITCVSTITIWESLKNGEPLDELISRVPDEFYDFVKSTVSDLENKYYDKLAIIELTYDELVDKLNSEFPNGFTQKQFAFEVFANASNISGLLFARHTNQDISKSIWRALKPEFVQPFKNNAANEQECVITHKMQETA
jgi:RNA ligase